MTAACEDSGNGACKWRTFAIWFCAGAGAGAVAGLLLSPSSGAENRRAASEKISTAVAAAQSLVEANRDKIESVTGEIKRQSQRAAAAVAAGIQEASRIKRELARMEEEY